MNTSHISDIYAALQALSVTMSDGTIPRAYGLAELPESINTAQLPCRLLLPVGNEPGEGREGSFIAIGTGMTIVWQVSDLMLWQASEQGLGLREFAPKIVEYAGKYLDAMRGFKCPYQDSSLDGVTIVPGEYEWPRGSGHFFSGVSCQLQIKEVVSG